MVSFKTKKRSDTKNLLVPRRTGGLFQGKRGGGSDGLLLRSDDEGGNDDVYERVLANGRIGTSKMPRSSSTGTPPQAKDPPSGGRSDVTPPLSPESDDEDEEDEDDDAVSSYLQFETAALDPPGHKLVTVSTTSNSLVQNLLSMMDKACVAPMEGEWGSGAVSVASSAADDAPEWSALGVAATTSSDEAEFPIAAPATGDSSKLQHYLDPQRGEKHESFEMILREKTPPRKKTLAGLKKALLHLPNLFPGGDSHGADSNGGTPDAAKSKMPKSMAKKSPPTSRDRKKGPATKRQERAAAARRERDTEGRLHKPLTPISEPIPVEEEKKEEEDRFVLLPPAPRVHSRKIDAAMAAIPKTIQTAPPITRHFSKEARYKQVLGSWMSTRTPLETITEDENRPEGSAAEPTVRVPGIRNPDKYLSQSDLIGEDVQSKASSDASPVATHVPSGGGAGTNSDIDQMDPQPASPIRKSRTWVGKWLGFGLDGGDDGAPTDTLSRSLSRQRSAPGNLTPQSSSVNAAFPKQRLWKAVVCEDSGRTYYYHRVSRRTTWTKPPEDELILANAKAPSHVVPEEDEIKQVRFPVLSKETEAALLVKRQVLAILHDMGQDATSVDKLLAQFEGREVELLDRLRSASEDQPFDELVSQAAGGVDESFTHSEPSTAAGSSARSNLAGRSRTQSSFVSGFSSALMSASTQPIRNTGIGRIFAAAGNAADVTPDVNSHATSISSKQGDMLPPAVNGAVASPKPHDRVPSNIPVPRARELHVEEFNYKREEKRHKGVIRSAPPKVEEVEATSYFGDNDDTDTKETDTVSPNDSISALSEADLSFTNVDQQRRQALDEAIEREDWDLAAELSESLRATKTKPIERKREWTQTELDRFISSNDWDAVANYIAQVRSGAKSGGHKDGKATDPGRGPQKRFGAKSQLQHKSIPVPGAPDEGWESASYSSYESEYSSSSSDTYEELLAARKREKFAC